MSYFAFGLMTIEAGRQAPSMSTLQCLRGCAQQIGLTITLGGKQEPAILAEMRGVLPVAGVVPFLCLGDPRADTSDALISPHAVGLEGAARGLSLVAKWIRCAIQEAGYLDVRLWLTEGFDDKFEEWVCAPQDLEGILHKRLREENDIPSLKIGVSSQYPAGAPCRM